MNAQRDIEEDALRDATHDAFMAFWRGVDTTIAETLWLAYCAAQGQYEAYLLGNFLSSDTIATALCGESTV